MKKKYHEVVDRFLQDQGPRFRYYHRRWWMINDGYWEGDARPSLQWDLSGYMEAFGPPSLARDLNQSDMNQICAYLARKLYTSHLPALLLAPENDPKLMLWGARPRRLLSDQELQ